MKKWPMTLVLLLAVPCPAPAGDDAPHRIRFATFNASLHRRQAGALVRDLSGPGNEQARKVAEIIQRVRPDVLLVNELDYDPAGKAAELFERNYLAVSQNGQPAIHYAHMVCKPVNTGIPSGHDLDNDGRADGPADAFGFGRFPGQYGMVVYSRLPLARDRIRTFRKFLWQDMPGALLPRDPATGQPYYGDEELAVLRLSSKSHWDIPVEASGRTIHFLVCHPTPPAFDGPEDRNGRRNHDEIRLLADYVDPARSGYLVDDRGKRGGLAAGALFVIAGDLNADPVDGASRLRAMAQLLEHPLIRGQSRPASRGGREAAARDGQANRRHRGDPACDTADFSDREPGNLCVDYVLASRTLKRLGGGIFWPAANQEGRDLVDASDHHLVWVDVE